ncbi:LysM peptidoglycan-binding domain-containing protein [Teredinibacter waterburyi]|jgi:Uncharacterized protein containing LysM domain|uniref:LysM peptidoglycan-binding domain-containing protein n=1 Tax=Teredinibacter waterburyi TaxID=1500538 RepID=UPI00165EEEEE|nr:LysM peptidoglycan-binding domain-containing protein [Teredinibacter waterburyi]
MKRLFSGRIAAFALTFALGGGVLFCGVAKAEEPKLRDNFPTSHTVVKGDTLWDISATFLQNPWMWPEIWHVNTQIKNPHLIYPGDLIRLIFMDGKPRLTLDTSGRVFKLSPKARVVATEDAIATIPLDEINSFLSRSRIVDEQEIEGAPYVLSGMDEHLIVGAGDKLYARGDFDTAERVYGLYRSGDVYVDPETREMLGMMAKDIGSLELISSERDVGTLKATRTTEEVRAGDRLLRQEERAIDTTFYPSAPNTEVNGVILAIEDGINQVGLLDVVVINRGVREGVGAGNVLAIYKRGGKIRDRVSQDLVQLPDERAGLLMVFRAFEKVSLGLVLEAERGISVSDRVRNP